MGRETRPPKTFLRQTLLSLATVVLVLPYRRRCRHVWEDEMCVPTRCRLCARIGYPTASMHHYEPSD